MTNPLVSIIIPVYNAESFLMETLNSALNQTWPNIEVILIDDGSTDSSLSIAKTFENNKVRVFTQQNKGASAARNNGLKEARGEFIQFLDADDLISPNKIQVQVEELLDHPENIAICSTIHFYTGQNHRECKPSEYEDSFLFSTTNPYEFLINLYGGNNNNGSMIQPNAWLTPFSLIKKAGNWNESLTVNDDGEFFCRVILAAKGILYLKNTFSYYRKTTNGLSLSGQKSLLSFKSQFESILLIYKHLIQIEDDRRVGKCMARALIGLLFECYPAFPDLIKKIEQKIKMMGGSDYQPEMGGSLIELIKNIFGWKIARRIQSAKSNLKKQSFWQFI